MKRAEQIIIFAIGCVAGIVAASFFYFSPNWHWLVWSALAAISLRQLKSKLAGVVMLVLGLLAGAAYMSFWINARPTLTIDDYQFRKINIVGEVYGDPYWDEQRNFVFYMRHLQVDGQPVAGEVRIKSLIGNAKEGYRMRVSGKNWPILGKTHNQISFARPTVVSLDQPFLIRLKANFVDGMRRALPEPAASFLIGILIGARSNLPKYLQDNLNTIGLSHIVAVSGYNLTILTVALARLLGKKWRWASLTLSLWAILAFVVLTGASPSILRAGIMAALFLLASFSGRNLAVEACIALGAIVTLTINPDYLLGDLSWQLSFLSLVGIVALAPKIKSFLPQRGKLEHLSDILAITLAAQLATLPLIAYTFGRISLIGPVANLLIMPLIPLLMLLGFVAGVIGIILPGAAYYLMMPLGRLMAGLITGFNSMASYSWSAAAIQNISFFQMVISYSLIVVLALLRRPNTFKIASKSGIMSGDKEMTSLQSY